ncbi:hypothetical protein ACHAWF_015196 [Thalassiosira exigua]
MANCCRLAAFVLLSPSLSCPATSARWSPILKRLDRGNDKRLTSFVSSWESISHRIPRAGARTELFRLESGRTRTKCDANGNRKRASLSVRAGGSDSGDEGDEGVAKTRGISISLFVAYLTVMAAKCALPSTLSMLTSPNSGLSHINESLSRQDVMSRLLALSTLSVAAGKLLLGPVIDRCGGVASLRAALSTLFVCLGAIGIGSRTCPTLSAMGTYWIVVDFAFSSCWAACVKAIRDYLPEERWPREIGQLAVAARSGNAVSFAFFAWLLQWASGNMDTQSTGGTAVPVDSSWRWVFRASAVIQLIPLLMLSYFGRKEAGSHDIVREEKQSKPHSQSTFQDSLAILYRQSRTVEFWLHLISRSIIMVLVSFLLFIPSYMTQCYEMSSASSARVGSIFALGCLLSVSTMAEKAYPPSGADIVTGQTGMPIYQRKAYSMLAFLLLATICLALQTAFCQGLVQLSPALGTLLMFIFGFSLGEIGRPM